MIEEETPEPELLRIKSISVEGLFGLYDHTIPLNLEDRVTIIHGPNGVGKTKLLHWTAALLRGDLSAFLDVPFRRFTVGLTNGTSINVEPVVESPREEDALLLVFSEQDGSAKGHILSREMVRRNRAVRRATNERDKKLAFVVDAIRKEEMPPWIRDVIDKISVHSVEAQRLFRHADEDEDRPDSESPLIPTVLDHSRDLHNRIRETLADYANTSQSLDQSFPQRLIQHQSSALDALALKQRMIALEAIRERLGELGLLAKEDRHHPFDLGALDRLEPERRLVLSVYVEDSEAKLQTLQALAGRIQIFLESINEKFTNKRIGVDPKAGLVAEDASNRTLALADLSSGEQHEIVLLYDLLFNTKPNTLVLIDEPELSLHITWQKRFLDDLLQITKLVGIDALVATHSPFIIGEREDLMVALEATPTPSGARP